MGQQVNGSPCTVPTTYHPGGKSDRDNTQQMVEQSLEVNKSTGEWVSLSSTNHMPARVQVLLTFSDDTSSSSVVRLTGFRSAATTRCRPKLPWAAYVSSPWPPSDRNFFIALHLGGEKVEWVSLLRERRNMGFCFLNLPLVWIRVQKWRGGLE